MKPITLNARRLTLNVPVSPDFLPTEEEQRKLSEAIDAAHRRAFKGAMERFEADLFDGHDKPKEKS